MDDTFPTFSLYQEGLTLLYFSVKTSIKNTSLGKGGCSGCLNRSTTDTNLFAFHIMLLLFHCFYFLFRSYILDFCNKMHSKRSSCMKYECNKWKQVICTHINISMHTKHYWYWSSLDTSPPMGFTNMLMCEQIHLLDPFNESVVLCATIAANETEVVLLYLQLSPLPLSNNYSHRLLGGGKERRKPQQFFCIRVSKI